MRYVIIRRDGEKYVTTFFEKGNMKKIVEAYVIASHEDIVAWIEGGKLPQ